MGHPIERNRRSGGCQKVVVDCDVGFASSCRDFFKHGDSAWAGRFGLTVIVGSLGALPVADNNTSTNPMGED
jgi:hypothetical protein